MGYYAAGGYYSAGGYYAAGGFFKKLIRGATKLSSFVTKNPLVSAVVGAVPFGGDILTGMKVVNGLGSIGGGGRGAAAAIADSMPGHPVTLARMGRRLLRGRRRRRR